MSPVAWAVVPLLGGMLLDLFLGDPPRLYHPVRLIGRLIEAMEGVLRRRFPPDRRGELRAGMVLAAVVPLAAFLACALVLLLAAAVHPLAGLALNTWLCYRILAAGSLRKESMAVYRELVRGDLPRARLAVSRIVGRDTEDLDEGEISRAAVETVAENTTDGVVAPLCFLALGGPALGFFYKAVSTMDSMVGYRDSRYRYLGRASARLDDLLNYFPARLSARLMILAASLPPFRRKEAKRVYLRDRYNHQSPNSAHTEAACAGALGIRLGGESRYGGEPSPKPYLGEEGREAVAEDIRLANRLMTATSLLALALACGFRALAAWLLNR